MRTIKLGLSKVEFYDSIKEMPIERYHEFQKLLLQDLGVGSDIESISGHFSNLYMLLSTGSTDAALQEAKNLHNNMYLAINEIGVSSYCFAALVKSINGKETELTEEGIKRTLKKLSKVSVAKSEEILFEVKKNLRQTLNHISLIDIQNQD